MTTQPATEHCDLCDARVKVSPESSFEFRYACGHYLKSWAHSNPAPVYVPEPEPQQKELFG